MLKFWKVGNLNDDYGFKFDILEMVDFQMVFKKKTVFAIQVFQTFNEF